MPSIPTLLSMLEKDPADPFLLYGLAQEYAKAGEVARALEAYDRCLTADPLYCYAYYHKARAQQGAGDLTGAVATVILGQAAARKAGDAHALSELTGLREDLEG